MKQKTGRKLLGFLLALAMAVGLMPGMSMTAYADTRTYKIQVKDLEYNYVKDVWNAGEVTLPYNTDGGTLNAVLSHPDGCSYVTQISGTNITVSGLNITITGVGSSEIETNDAYSHTFRTVIIVTENKANPTATPPAPTANYGQTLANVSLTNPAGNTPGTWTWVSAGTTSVGNAGQNTFQAKFTPTDTTNYKTLESVNVTVTVYKADPVYVTPTGLSAFVGQTLGDVALPTADNGTWSWEEDTTAKLNDIGMTTYHAKFTPNDTDNYNIIENIEVQIQVTEKPLAVPATVTANSRTFDGTAKPLVTVDDSTLVGGEMRYALGTKDAATGTYSASIPVATNAGTYYVWYKVAGDANHNDTEPQSVTSTIVKAYPKVTAPKARSLTYTGKAQELVEAGTAKGGTMQYSLDGKSFSEKVPTGTEAKAYTVWYKVVGDENHNDTETQSVTSTIAKKDEPAPTPAPDPDPEPTPAPAVTVARVTKPKTVAYPSKAKAAVSWKAAKGAKSYQLQWRKAGAKKWTTVSAKGKSKTVTGLKVGTLYEFRVRGANGKVRGKWSAASLRWLKGASKVKAASGKAKGTIKATWKADKAATGGYKVFVYSKKGGKVVATKTVKAGATSATVKGLKSGKTYYVRVRPYRVKSGTTYTGVISGWRTAKAK